MDTNQKMTAEDFRLPPDPERIVNGLRDTGYNFNTAIADITTVGLTYSTNSLSQLCPISIDDNTDGAK